MTNANTRVSDRKSSIRGQRACGGLALVLIAGAVACESARGPAGGSGGPASGGRSDSFSIEYRSGASALLDLRASGTLRFAGPLPGVPRTLPSVGVAHAHAMVAGNGQQTIELVLSTGRALWEGETFAARLEFSRANHGETLDRGDSFDMGCSFSWAGPGYDVAIDANCRVRQTGGGYSLTVLESYHETTTLSGSLTFSPVTNEAYAYTPGYGCPSDQICLSLDASDYGAETGYCLPRSNLKSEASPCGSDCDTRLTLSTGGAPLCVCSHACGRIAVSGGAGSPPVCDPAYGCIDF